MAQQKPPAGEGTRSGADLVRLYATVIKVPVEDWPGNCHGIASLLCKRSWVDGIPRYGHWLGGAAPGTLFDNGAPFRHHGWIRLNQRQPGCFDLLDPTRWVFETNDPNEAFIYYGYEREPEYDPGGNRWRRAMEKPCPPARPGASVVDLRMEPVFLAMLRALAGHTDRLTMDHAFWLANLSLATLGILAKPLYAALAEAGLKALVPMDNWNMVMVQGTFDPLADLMEAE